MQITNLRPNLKNRLFWEFDLERTDWQLHALSIISRVIERGTHDDWDELVRFYSMDKVTDVLKNTMKTLPDEIIEDACSYFKLKPEDLLCYTRKQLHPGHWL